MKRGLSSALRPGAAVVVILAAAAGCARPAPAPVAPLAVAARPITNSATSLPGLPGGYLERADPEQVVELVGSKAKLVARELRQARSRGDTAGAHCLDENLSQIHAEARRAREQADALADARRREDRAAMKQHRVMLGVVLEDADELVSHARRCSGQEAADPGSRVIVDDRPAVAEGRHAGL